MVTGPSTLRRRHPEASSSSASPLRHAKLLSINRETYGQYVLIRVFLVCVVRLVLFTVCLSVSFFCFQSRLRVLDLVFDLISYMCFVCATCLISLNCFQVRILFLFWFSDFFDS